MNRLPGLDEADTPAGPRSPLDALFDRPTRDEWSAASSGATTICPPGPLPKALPASWRVTTASPSMTAPPTNAILASPGSRPSVDRAITDVHQSGGQIPTTPSRHKRASSPAAALATPPARPLPRSPSIDALVPTIIDARKRPRPSDPSPNPLALALGPSTSQSEAAAGAHPPPPAATKALSSQPLPPPPTMATVAGMATSSLAEMLPMADFHATHSRVPPIEPMATVLASSPAAATPPAVQSLKSLIGSWSPSPDRGSGVPDGSPNATSTTGAALDPGLQALAPHLIVLPAASWQRVCAIAPMFSRHIGQLARTSAFTAGADAAVASPDFGSHDFPTADPLHSLVCLTRLTEDLLKELMAAEPRSLSDLLARQRATIGAGTGRPASPAMPANAPADGGSNPADLLRQLASSQELLPRFPANMAPHDLHVDPAPEGGPAPVDEQALVHVAPQLDAFPPTPDDASSPMILRRISTNFLPNATFRKPRELLVAPINADPRSASMKYIAITDLDGRLAFRSVSGTRLRSVFSASTVGADMTSGSDGARWIESAAWIDGGHTLACALEVGRDESTPKKPLPGGAASASAVNTRLASLAICPATQLLDRKGSTQSKETSPSAPKKRRTVQFVGSGGSESTEPPRFITLNGVLSRAGGPVERAVRVCALPSSDSHVNFLAASDAHQLHAVRVRRDAIGHRSSLSAGDRDTLESMPLRLYRSHTSSIRGLALAADGATAFSGGSDGRIFAFDVERSTSSSTETGRFGDGLVAEWSLGQRVGNLVAYPTNRHILLACMSASSNQLRFIDQRVAPRLPSDAHSYSTPEGELVFSWRDGEGENLSMYICPAISPDGNLVACGTSSALIRLWDVRNPRGTIGVSPGAHSSMTIPSEDPSSDSFRAGVAFSASHKRPVVRVAFHPHKNILFSLSTDRGLASNRLIFQ
ncbi:hypothetical protein H696_03619 [Fonticula alba]|uniref:Uncharacterized protein n=1 Tax=Fonticula alba TaxID=691883 RepID=A0A058Z789_FONAL|nr:hypothetical protein H696_03619 [Fonticula alba]KCV70159.1 hypothetical protein H696_03619 [Fonticula alba]|eukprot:XP_009495765.1 hypothetical protein H696_03619 [Fonticula alba]